MNTRTAIVHDRIYHIGGAEAVMIDQVSCEMIRHPENKITIFTLFSNQTSLTIQNQNISIITAIPLWMFKLFQYFEKHKVWGLTKLFDYRNLMFFYPILVRILRHKVRKYHPDRVLVSSFAAVKNIVPIYPHNNKNHNPLDYDGRHLTGEGPINHLYLHSPMQYIWDYYEENLTKLKPPISWIYQLITPILRKRDKIPRNYNTVITNSHYTASMANKLYGRNCVVHYPAIDPSYYGVSLLDQGDYYIYVGRLVRFAKEVELIIRLFNHTGDKLILLGSGPDEQYLKSIALSNIEFKGQITNLSEKMQLVGQARGLINLTRESFGMVTREALCQGIPVFGYNEGGSVELVNSESGILINDKSLNHVISEFERFKLIDRDRHCIYRLAQMIFDDEQ